MTVYEILREYDRRCKYALGAVEQSACDDWLLAQLTPIIAAAEREACAKVCEEVGLRYPVDIWPDNGESLDCQGARMGRRVSKNCAAAIRARVTDFVIVYSL